MVFHKAQMFVLACQPTGGLNDDEMFSLAVARHTGAMASGLDYAFKDTPYWCAAYPSWQLAICRRVHSFAAQPEVAGRCLRQRRAVSDISPSSTDAATATVESDGVFKTPVGRKKPKRARAEDLTVSNAMLSVAKSMAASAESVGKNAAAQSERNGILFIGKFDVEDESAQEFFLLRKKMHLDNARSEATTASVAAAATMALTAPPLLHAVKPAGADNSPVDAEEEDGLDSL